MSSLFEIFNFTKRIPNPHRHFQVVADDLEANKQELINQTALRFQDEFVSDSINRQFGRIEPDESILNACRALAETFFDRDLDFLSQEIKTRTYQAFMFKGEPLTRALVETMIEDTKFEVNSRHQNPTSL